MNSLRALVFLLAAMLGLTCAPIWAAEAAPTNAERAIRGRIVVLGDSITAGYGLPLEQAYPAKLQAKLDAAQLPYQIANAGVSGDTTSGGLRRVDWALKGGAEVLIIALGGNDGLRGIAPEVTADNLRKIVARAREKLPQIAVIIAGMQMPSSMGETYTAAYRELFPQVAQETKSALVPFLLQNVGGIAALNQPDLIHPTAEGHEKVAANVWPVLQQVLEARRSNQASTQ